MSGLTYGSLFSGYEGLTMGVQSVLGGTTKWHSEIDKGACKILAHHWPDIPNLGDITTVDWANVEPVDVLTGGFPCQDVSHAGRRAGLIRDGEGRTRSGLWGQMLQAIDTLRPRLVVAENVRGLLSATADSDLEPCAWCMGDAGASPMRALGAVLADLADVGYDAAWYGLRAADVGAAHGRFRVFIFGTPADTERVTGRLIANQRGVQRPRTDSRDPADLTLLPTPAVNDMGEGKTVEYWDAWTATMQAKHGNGNGHGKSLSIEALRLLPTPRTSDTNGAGAHGQGGMDLRTATALLPTPTTRDTKGHNQRGDDTCLTGALLPTPRATDGTKGGPNQRGSSGDLMLPSAVRLLPTPTTSMDSKASGGGYNGQTNVTLTDATVRRLQSWGDYGPAIARHEAALGRPAPAPTKPGRTGNPKLAGEFVEWLMGLPAGHVTDPAIGISDNEQLKALGNGVVPAQAAAATRRWLSDSLEASA